MIDTIRYCGLMALAWIIEKIDTLTSRGPK